MKLMKTIACGIAAIALTLTGCDDGAPEVPDDQEAPVEQAAPADPADAVDVAAEAKAEAEKTVTAENAETVLADLTKEIEADLGE